MVELSEPSEALVHLPLPFYEEGINAGFPFPPSDTSGDYIDLNQELLRSPETTFCGRVRGESMAEAGIHSGDIIIIDKALPWSSGDIVVAYLNGEFTIKRIVHRSLDDRLVLVPANPEYREIEIDPYDDLRIWGVVTYVIHSLRSHRQG